MSDLDFVGEGIIRVRFSNDGPLKEDKKDEGKVKWVPAPEDITEFLGPWLDARKAAGAGPEDRVFPCKSRKGLCYRKEYDVRCAPLPRRDLICCCCTRKREAKSRRTFSGTAFLGSNLNSGGDEIRCRADCLHSCEAYRGRAKGNDRGDRHRAKPSHGQASSAGRDERHDG